MKLNVMLNRCFYAAYIFITLGSVSGCTTTLVTPYDESLVTGTEAFYKKAAGLIEEARVVSPKTDAERSAIQNPASHKGHFSKYESKYNDLIVDTEVLILRAMAGDSEIDAKGKELQAKISQLIDETVTSEQCKQIHAAIGETSLTAKNFVDLKCLVTQWKLQHADSAFTKTTLILKKANWEARKQHLFNAILAIQKAEGFKNKGIK